MARDIIFDYYYRLTEFWYEEDPFFYYKLVPGTYSSGFSRISPLKNIFSCPHPTSTLSIPQQLKLS